LGAPLQKDFMSNKRQLNSTKRYGTFFVYGVLAIVIGFTLGVLNKGEGVSINWESSFLFTLFLSVVLMVLAFSAAYLTYQYWFQEDETRKKLTSSIKKMGKEMVIFRSQVYNPKYLFWYIKIISPIILTISLAIFFLVVFSAF
jgi:hypothetical protein